MKALYCGALAVLATIACLTQAQSAEKQPVAPTSKGEADRSVASGAHRFAGPDGKPTPSPAARHADLHARRPHVSAAHVSQVGKLSIQ